MRQYLVLVERIFRNGVYRPDVQGVGNIAVPGHQFTFNLDHGFPLITHRSLKGSWKALVHELLWFVSGSTQIADLHKHGVHLWDQWATPEICARYGYPAGELGPIYGTQWRKWRMRDGGEIDQLANVILMLKDDPYNRRSVVSAWNPEDVPNVFIAPCHHMFMFFVGEGKLYLHLIQRSADTLVGVPFNIASYSLLLLMVSYLTGLKPGGLVHSLHDCHIYMDQLPFVEEILEREPRSLPRVRLADVEDVRTIDDFRFEHFVLEDYDPHPPIKGIPVAV